jgi:hypothetical protein
VRAALREESESLRDPLFFYSSYFSGNIAEMPAPVAPEEAEESARAASLPEFQPQQPQQPDGTAPAAAVRSQYSAAEYRCAGRPADQHAARRLVLGSAPLLAA